MVRKNCPNCDKAITKDTPLRLVRRTEWIKSVPTGNETIHVMVEEALCHPGCGRVWETGRRESVGTDIS